MDDNVLLMRSTHTTDTHAHVCKWIDIKIKLNLRSMFFMYSSCSFFFSYEKSMKQIDSCINYKWHGRWRTCTNIMQIYAEDWYRINIYRFLITYYFSLPRFLFLFYNLESMGWMGLNPSSPEELETKSIFFGNKQRGKPPPPPLPKR